MITFLILSGILLLTLAAFWLLLKSAAFLAENSASLLKVAIIASIVILGTLAAVIWFPNTPESLKTFVHSSITPIMEAVHAY